MKIIFRTVDGTPFNLTTVGYWRFNEPLNHGDLEIYISHMKDWRHRLAVNGHELIEAIYCKLRGITTETCDKFDWKTEEEIALGQRDPNVEPGFDPKCPYRLGHIMGSWWERLVITVTFASWRGYDEACNVAMGL